VVVNAKDSRCTHAGSNLPRAEYRSEKARGARVFACLTYSLVHGRQRGLARAVACIRGEMRRLSVTVRSTRPMLLRKKSPDRIGALCSATRSGSFLGCDLVRS